MWGDASQPLHVSKYHHGGGRSDNPAEKLVHEEYDTKIIERFADNIIIGVNTTLSNKKAPSRDNWRNEFSNFDN
jgi:hypothetical protein